jgi:hypothetical protein
VVAVDLADDGGRIDLAVLVDGVVPREVEQGPVAGIRRVREALTDLLAFSVWLAAGRKKTSVSISSVFSSPDSISGPSFHHVADSMREKSRTTSHLRWLIAMRCMRPFADPTAGFCPRMKKPSTLSASIRSAVWYVPWAPLIRGR